MRQSLFSLTVSDNGKVIPEDPELENAESLGLQFICSLGACLKNCIIRTRILVQ
jgi:two-component sensor histidine kinase